MQSEKQFYVKLPSSNPGDERRLRASQCTVTNISSLFGVDSNSLFLTDGSRVEFADENGVFCTSEFEDLDFVTVCTRSQGSSPQAVQQLHQPSSDFGLGGSRFRSNSAGSTASAGVLGGSMGACWSSSSGFKTSARQSWLPQAGARKAKAAGQATVKIVHATRKADGTAGTQLSQYFMNITEDTANVPSISRTCREYFDDHRLVLCSPNGLAIPDSSATSGLHYWKVGSRKIFALRPAHASKKRRKELPEEDTSDTEELLDGRENLMAEKNAMKRSSSPSSKLESINCDIAQIKESLQALTAVSEATPVPLPILLLLKTTFKCVICHDVIAPPVIYSTCCQTIIGCESCVDRWYRMKGESMLLTKKCPHCNIPRGFSKAQRLKGLDDFLQDVSKLANRHHLQTETAAGADGTENAELEEVNIVS